MRSVALDAAPLASSCDVRGTPSPYKLDCNTWHRTAHGAAPLFSDKQHTSCLSYRQRIRCVSRDAARSGTTLASVPKANARPSARTAPSFHGSLFDPFLLPRTPHRSMRRKRLPSVTDEDGRTQPFPNRKRRSVWRRYHRANRQSPRSVARLARLWRRADGAPTTPSDPLCNCNCNCITLAANADSVHRYQRLPIPSPRRWGKHLPYCPSEL